MMDMSGLIKLSMVISILGMAMDAVLYAIVSEGTALFKMDHRDLGTSWLDVIGAIYAMGILVFAITFSLVGFVMVVGMYKALLAPLVPLIALAIFSVGARTIYKQYRKRG